MCDSLIFRPRSQNKDRQGTFLGIERIYWHPLFDDDSFKQSWIQIKLPRLVYVKEEEQQEEEDGWAAVGSILLFLVSAYLRHKSWHNENDIPEEDHWFYYLIGVPIPIK